MNTSADAQTQSECTVLTVFDKEFAHLLARSRRLIEVTPTHILYRNPPSVAGSEANSIGESILRSAGAVEQTFGGITASLWDDPFEWTLPETLGTRERVMEYLAEVEQTRERAFLSFSRDAELLKRVAIPSGETLPLVTLLLHTLVRSAEYQGQATATLKILSDVTVPGFII